MSCAPVCDVYKFNNPDDALSVWYDIIMPIINVHAPLRKKRVKHPKLPLWLTRGVITAMAVRNRLQKEKGFEDFKKQRNKVKSLVRSAKKSYFDKLIELDKSNATIWKAINEITNKSHNNNNTNKKKSFTTTISRNISNSHFLTLAETLVQSSGFTSDNFTCSKSLRDFCNKKINKN